MTDPLYVSRSSLETAGHLHRRARLATGETLDMGVQGPVATRSRATRSAAPPRTRSRAR